MAAKLSFFIRGLLLKPHAARAGGEIAGQYYRARGAETENAGDQTDWHRGGALI
jgi:hypothetical protein